MKSMALNEIEKATGEKPKRSFTELCMVKSFKNMLRD